MKTRRYSLLRVHRWNLGNRYKLFPRMRITSKRFLPDRRVSFRHTVTLPALLSYHLFNMDQSALVLEVVKIINGLISSKYATVASMTLLLWDMLLTLDLEVRRVWRVKRSLGTTLFLLNRYLVPPLFILDIYAQFMWDPSMKFCKNYEIASTILQLVSVSIVESVLVLRTHALYQSMLLLLILTTLCFISIANMLVMFLLVIRLETISSASLIGVRGCLSGCTNPVCQPLLIGFWVPYLFFETLVFVLTVWRSYTSFLAFKRRRPSGFRTTFIEIIVRDGLVYYVVIMAVSIVNFLIWIIDPFASYLAVGLMKSLQATICSRLLLNIRGMLEAQGTPSMISDSGLTHDSSIAVGHSTFELGDMRERGNTQGLDTQNKGPVHNYGW
ncbi:hypothetical protein BJ165DRAFT_1440164 [Panaeolus papilionaceus]|nr:hypothetical protein BJ165DRAFT_1440164 [Panaeolus papilionaceus]